LIAALARAYVPLKLPSLKNNSDPDSCGEA